MAHQTSDTIRAEELVPGDVIVFRKAERERGQPTLALVVSQDVPATTLTQEEAEAYCEPGLQIIKHTREDFWTVTHHFTYALFKRRARIERNNSVRVRVARNYGEFLNEVGRKQYFRQPEYSGATNV